MTEVLRHRAVGASFFDEAPHVTTVRQQLPASPLEVWGCLEDADAWTVWLGLDRVTWTSELGPDATRTVKDGLLTIEEEFFLWEPGEVMAFRFARSLLPVSGLAERYALTDNGDGTTELAWTFAVDSPLPFVGGLLLGRLRALAERSTPRLAELLAAG